MVKTQKTDIILSIQVDGKKAATSLADYQKEIDRLKQSQKDLKKELKEGKITSDEYYKKFAKNKVDLTTTQKKTRELTKEMVNQKQALNLNKGSVEQMSLTLTKMRKRYDGLSAAERKNIKVGGALQKNIQMLDARLKDVDATTGRFQRSVGDYENKVGAAIRSTSGLSKGIGNLGAITGGVGATLVRSLTSPLLLAVGIFSKLGQGLSSITKKSKSFAAQMSKLKAISGATTTDMLRLSSAAIRLGSTTTKTASEVAQLQLNLSKLGFTTKDILNATKAITLLSEATGEDLAESATVVASTLNAFSLSTEHAGRVSDVMAKAISSSALDLQKFKVAMATIAPVASQYGASVEETTAQLATLVDSGLDASVAGTYLRKIYTELTVKGISYNDALNNIQNSSDKANTAIELFGKRAYGAGLILAKSQEKTDGLTNSFNNAAGAALKMANIAKDDLSGDLKALSSVWEGLQLNIENGQGAIAEFSRAAIQSLTALISLFTASGMSAANANIDKQASKLSYLYSVLSDNNNELDRRQTALNELKKIVPDYHASLTEEGKLINDNKIAIDNYLDSFEEKIKKEAFATDYAEEYSKNFNIQRKIFEEEEKRLAKNNRLKEKGIDMQVEMTEKERRLRVNLKKSNQELKFIQNEMEAFNKKLKESKPTETISPKSTTAQTETTQTEVGNDIIVETDEQRNARLNKIKKAADEEIKIKQQTQALANSLLKDGIEKAKEAIKLKNENEVAALKKRLLEDETLTAESRKLINEQINLKATELNNNLAKLDADEITRQANLEQEKLNLKIKYAKKGSDEKYRLETEQLEAERVAAIAAATKKGLDLEQVNAYYDNLQSERKTTKDEEDYQKELEVSRLHFEQKLLQMQMNHESTLQLELEQKQLELESLQQLQGESDDAFNLRKLQKEKEVADTETAIKAKQVADENALMQAKLSAFSGITGAIDGIIKASGTKNKALLRVSRGIALANIYLSQAMAIANAIKTATQSSVSVWDLVANIGVAVGTVVASTVSAFNSIKKSESTQGFATGGYVSGSGTSTSDSIDAKLSNGESVNNAASTEMFAPLYSALNQIGGGVPIEATGTSSNVNGEDMLARAFAKGVASLPNPVVSVEDITTGNQRVEVIEQITSL